MYHPTSNFVQLYCLNLYIPSFRCFEQMFVSLHYFVLWFPLFSLEVFIVKFGGENPVEKLNIFYTLC